MEGKAFRFRRCVETILHSLVKLSPDSTPALVPGLTDTHRPPSRPARLPAAAKDDDDDDDDDDESSLVGTESSVRGNINS
jgi:hypothetical protein